MPSVKLLYLQGEFEYAIVPSLPQVIFGELHVPIMCFVSSFKESMGSIMQTFDRHVLGFVVLLGTWRPLLGCAIRFGEASHPGPKPANQSQQACNQFVVCVTNPTCIAKKADTVGELLRSKQVNFLTMSETAATAAMQRSFTSHMRSHGVKCHWSTPVRPHRNTITSEEILRGKAAGVALLSTQPSRLCRNPVDPEWDLSSRFLHCVVHLHTIPVQMVILYCRPLSVSDATEFNNKLMAYAWEQVQLVGLPYIIAGDFNMPVESFATWPAMEGKGCASLSSIHPLLKGQPYPATCQGSTSPDNAILSHDVRNWLCDIEVLDSSWLATHHPVCFTLRTPGEILFRTKYLQPKEFVELPATSEGLDAAFQALHCGDHQPTTIEQWGLQLGGLVDYALRHPCDPQVPAQSLPKAYRGRCQPPKKVKVPVLSPVKGTRVGEFAPAHEIYTVSTQRKLKQLRRIQSLCHRVRKLEASGTPSDDNCYREWQTIVTSTAFGPSFLHWVWNEDWFHPPEFPFPTFSWLHDLLQLVKYHVDNCVYWDHQVKQKHLAYQRFTDRKQGSKGAFAQVRGPRNQQIVEIQDSVQFEGIIHPEDDDCFVIHGDQQQLERLSKQFIIKVDDSPATLLDIETHHILVRFQEPYSPAHEVTVTQHQWWVEPAQLAEQLNLFWQPIWNQHHENMELEDTFQEYEHLFASLPPHDTIPIDMLDVDQWVQAVRSLQPSVARGVDRVSASELQMVPREMLASLAYVMSQYPSGFPAWFMEGIACPHAKVTTVPCNNQSRPITILAQLYRVWAKVCFQQTTNKLNQWIPRGVTGLLPGRGSTDCAFRAQFALEVAKFGGPHRSGLTLDLRKCFNTIKWSFGFHALIVMGLPRPIVEQWFASIMVMRRTWSLLSELWDAGTATGGFPEGDHFSVLIMISLATVWTCTIMNAPLAIDIANTLFISAYADNWSWMACDHRCHGLLMDHTQIVTQPVGVTIDYTKTWYFCTHSGHVKLIQEDLSEFLEGKTIQCVSGAKDLGHQMHYSGVLQVGSLAERIANGNARLERLGGMLHSVETKEHMVASSVLPAVLHACETRPLSDASLKSLRSKLAHALVGHAPNMTPCLVLLLCHNGILDPEFVMIKKTILAARLFLLEASQDDTTYFLNIAAAFQGTLLEVRGPATALAFCLSLVGWQIDRRGNLLTSAFDSFCITTCSIKRITRLLVRAWQKDLIVGRTQRHSWFRTPDICRTATVRALSHFQGRPRVALLKELSGAYQLETQKQKWATDATGICRFCPQEDSRCHRMVECPAGHTVRTQYEPVLQWIEETGSRLPEFPFATVHPYADLIHTLFFQLTLEPPSDSLRAHVHLCQTHGVPIHWTTDGACQMPHLPDLRQSAFVVILDTCTTDEERCAVVSTPVGNSHNKGWKAVFAGRTPGEQDILRAELTALTWLIVNLGYGIIHTDSQVSIDLLQRVFHATSIRDFHHCEHFDLLLQVWNVRQSHQCQLRKIKAHQVPHQVADPLERYFVLGNILADETAGQVLQKHLPACKDIMEDVTSAVEVEALFLPDFFRLSLALQTEYKAAAAGLDSQPVGAQASEDIFQAFMHWVPFDAYSFLPQLTLDHLHGSMFGDGISVATLRWLAEFTWTEETMGPLDQPTGVSWLELAMSWILFSGSYLPIAREVNGDSRIILIGSDESARVFGTSWLEQGTQLQKVFDHIVSLVPEAITPPLTRKKVPSLYMQGCDRNTVGWTIRPGVPHQQRVAQLVRNLFSTGNWKQQHVCPVMNFAGEDQFLAGSFSFRLAAARRAQQAVRALRST